MARGKTPKQIALKIRQLKKKITRLKRMKKKAIKRKKKKKR